MSVRGWIAVRLTGVTVDLSVRSNGARTAGGVPVDRRRDRTGDTRPAVLLLVLVQCRCHSAAAANAVALELDCCGVAPECDWQR